MSEGRRHSPARRVALAVVCVGFVASAVVHVANCLGYSWDQRWMVLHLIAIGLGFCLVLSNGGGRVALRNGASRRWPWTQYLPLLAMGYFFVTFAATAILSEGGVPQERDGQLVLANRGHVIRALGPEEFRSLKAGEARLWTAGWMLVYVLVGLHLAAGPEDD